ncbi:MAG: hypothetical protein KatS3mg113_0864 [Planctomycetaceae bacterium]|nr:MAG: hypothetical protein KatS3mg113_0864 [Planctomycetaceae bacterium]
MSEVLTNLWLVIWSLSQLVLSLLFLMLPWSPLLAWVAFWLFAVNWVKLREILLQGGIIAVFLIALMTILVWGLVSPPVSGSHYIVGLTVGNFVGKTVYVTSLLVIMFLCGSVQLTGLCDAWLHFADDGAVTEDHPHTDDHHGHLEHPAVAANISEHH